jgi:hypothetical protein
MDEIIDYTDLLDPTVDMENPFVPAPLGDTVVLERGWAPQPEHTGE